MIKPIPYYKTIPFHKEGKKNNLIFHENTNHIGYYIKKELVAIAGYDVLEKKAILRTAFVDQNYRSQGIYDKLVNWRIDFLKSKNIKIIEMTCTDYSIKYHLSRGANIIKQFKNYTKINYKL